VTTRDLPATGSVIGVFVRVLGTLVVEAGTPPVPLPVPGAKERALLGRLLVSAGHPVGVDTLAEDLWAGDPPPTARKSLQAHVVRLRSALEPQRPNGSPGRYVVRRGDGYALAVPPDAVDVSVVSVHAAAGRAAATGGDAAGAREHFAAALDLWRGEPFADWRDAAWAQGERRRLADVRSAVLEARLDADLALGRHLEVVAELERLVADQPLREGWWARLMMALYRSDRQAEALAAGRRARAVMAEELGLDPGPGLQQLERAILDQAATLDGARTPPLLHPAPRVPPAQSADCPYRGLATYQAVDSEVFCGRGATLRALVSRTATARLVVVSGPSGAGKSSLVRAGLLPALARGVVSGSAGWRPLVITPGLRPVDRLAPLLSPDENADADAEENGSAAIRAPVILVVDQFEELWTAGAPDGEREAFLDAVMALLDDGLAARVVLAVRGDHLGRLAEHPVLAERAADGMLLVPPLTEAELREVVEGPAAVAGLDVDPDLVDAVLREVAGQPAALPLLSTALVATWERRRDTTLTLAGYLEAGGVTGALARTAEAALACLDEQGRPLARRLLVRLAATGDGAAVVRRRVPVAELGFDGTDGAARRAVVEAFVSRRLLSIDADHLEVTHEALLVAWPRLAGWLAEDAAGRAVRTHLAPEARDWDDTGRPEDRLYRGARLAAAQDWLARPDADPGAVEREFIIASTARSEAELAESRAQTQRERAGRRRTRRLAYILAAAMVLAIAAGGLALQRQRQAATNALIADANRLAAASANAPSLDTSLLLAAQAFRTRDTLQTEDGLLAAAVQHRQVAHVYRADGVVRHIAVSPDGRTLYAHADQQVVAWDLATGEKRVLAQYTSPSQYPTDVDASPAPTGLTAGLVAIVTPPVPGASDTSTMSLLGPDGRARWTRAAKELGGWPVAVRFTADGTRVAVEVIEDYGGRHPAVLHVFLDALTGTAHPVGPRSPFLSYAFYDPWWSGIAPGAGSLLVGSIVSALAQRVGVFDVTRGTTTWLDREGRDPDAAFFPLTGGVLEGATDGAMYWYPRGATRMRQKLADHTSQVTAAATDASGTVLVTGGSDHRVVVHHLEHGTWVSREVLTGHQGSVLEVVVSRDGKRAFSTGDDRTVIEWDLTDQARFGSVIEQLDDPHDVAADPVIMGVPAWVGEHPIWVVPVIAHGYESRAQMVAAFMDPGTRTVLDWVPIGTRTPAFPAAAAAVSRDGRRVAVTAEFATAMLDARTHRILKEFELSTVDGRLYGADGPEPEPVTTAGWNADGSRLFLGTGESLTGKGTRGAVVVVNTATWRPERRLFEGGGVYALTVSPDGRLIAAGDVTGRVTVADASTYRVVRTLRARDTVRGLAFSPDGSRLAAVGDSKRLDVWDVASGRAVFAQPAYFSGAGTSVQWLPGGHEVVYGGWDGQAVLYDVDRQAVRGVSLPVYRDGGEGQVFVAPIRGDQLALLPGARIGGVVLREGVVYSLRPSDWLAHACDVVGRDLTRAEWAAYAPELPYQATCSQLG
jgi:DNA-binding SARP family transcriptional activator/WD40 repeat protein